MSEHPIPDPAAVTVSAQAPLAAAARDAVPKFTTGPVLHHILVMTGLGAVGLMAIFISDLANMLFLSWTGDEAVLAAIGYASSVQFLTISVGIGLAIAASSLVAPALGGRRRDEARRLSASAHTITFIVSAAVALIVWVFVPDILSMLGATGRTLDLASTYLRILTPTLPLLASGMTSAAVLRSTGDAPRAMFVTLFGAIANVALDLVLIVWLETGIVGAAWASSFARVVIMLTGFYGVIVVHGLMSRLSFQNVSRDIRPLAAIATAAVLANIATPFSNAYVTAAIAPYGDAAVAAWAVIGRITPVAFGAIYALSGAVGPIIGQNYGAGDASRVRAVLTGSLQVTAAFTLAAWIVLALGAEAIAQAFNATPAASALIVYFCRWLSPLFLFLGALFVANAAFNTLGKSHFSTLLNWGRATLGTIPFVFVGGMIDGAPGVLAGNMAGGILFGIVAVALSYRFTRPERLAAMNRANLAPLVNQQDSRRSS